MEVRTDRRYRFEEPTDVVWAALTRMQDYEQWWPWLRAFEATAFAAGERWVCEVQPPLPYRVRFGLTLQEVTIGESVSASLDGDLRGTARLDLRPVSTGSELHLVSVLEPATPLLRAMMRFLDPLARYGHDWIIDRGLQQFEARLRGGG